MTKRCLRGRTGPEKTRKLLKKTIGHMKKVNYCRFLKRGEKRDAVEKCEKKKMNP